MQVVGGFADLNGDGRAELICLQDRFQSRPQQALAIYKLSKGTFQLLARAPLRSSRIAYALSGVEQWPAGPVITVFVTTPHHCIVRRAAGTRRVGGHLEFVMCTACVPPRGIDSRRKSAKCAECRLPKGWSAKSAARFEGD